MKTIDTLTKQAFMDKCEELGYNGNFLLSLNFPEDDIIDGVLLHSNPTCFIEKLLKGKLLFVNRISLFKEKLDEMVKETAKLHNYTIAKADLFEMESLPDNNLSDEEYKEWVPDDISTYRVIYFDEADKEAYLEDYQYEKIEENHYTVSLWSVEMDYNSAKDHIKDYGVDDLMLAAEDYALGDFMFECEAVDIDSTMILR